MFPFTSPLTLAAPGARSVGIAALLGVALLVSPLAASAAATGPHHHSAAAMKETVEQRITSLHAALKITPDEEANWTNVAQAMRDNEARMQKLVAEQTALSPHSVNAVEDLRTYEKFTQAHVDGLKTLIGSFETLYKTMPDDQKALADHVFQKFGHRDHRSHA